MEDFDTIWHGLFVATSPIISFQNGNKIWVYNGNMMDFVQYHNARPAQHKTWQLIISGALENTFSFTKNQQIYPQNSKISIFSSSGKI